jgi:hypothetical protein
VGGVRRTSSALGLLALLATACTTTAGGGEGDGDGTPGSDGAPGGPDAEAACVPPEGATSGKLVRVVYMVPSDREPDPRYIASLQQATLSLQLWLRDQMPSRTSFRLHSPLVNVVRTEHPEAYYRTNQPEGGEPYYRFWDNVRDDTFLHLDTGWNDPDNIWVVYADADEACDQLGSGAVGHLAVLSKNDLRGLVGEPTVPPCGGDPDTAGRCRWVGGMALFLFYALEVPNPPDAECDDACRNELLTWFGYTAFPDAIVDEMQKDYLAGTGFVSAVGLPDCEVDCSVVPEPP